MKTRLQVQLAPSLVLLLLIALITGAGPVDARANDRPPDDTEETDTPHHTAHHDHPPRHAALFAGVSNGVTRELALGGDLAYRLPGWGGRLSISAYGDATLFAEHMHTLAGAGLAVTPWPNTRIAVMPGAEFTKGHSSFAMRAAVSYSVHLGRLSIAPTLNLDVVKGHVNEVIGFNIGTSF